MFVGGAMDGCEDACTGEGMIDIDIVDEEFEGGDGIATEISSATYCIL